VPGARLILLKAVLLINIVIIIIIIIVIIIRYLVVSGLNNCKMVNFLTQLRHCLNSGVVRIASQKA